METIPKGYPNRTQVEAMVAQAFYSANKSCSAPWVLDYSNPISNSTSLTFHNVLSILSGAAFVISTAIAIYLLAGHLSNWTCGREQKQFCRIILFIPVFTLCAALSTLFYHADGYIAPWGQWYEGFAICALFLLYVELVERSRLEANVAHPRDQAFGSTSTEASPLSIEKGPQNGSPGRRLALLVFQIMITRPITTIAQEALYGTMCPLSGLRPKGALIISVVQGFSTSLSVVGCFRLERRYKTELKPHRGAFKLISFKLVVLFQFVQQILFNALATETSVFFPTPPYLVSWNDYDKGIPQFILSWECVLVVIAFLWSFNSGEYRRAYNQETAKAGIGKALGQIFDIRDIMKATIAIFTGGPGEAGVAEERHGTLSHAGAEPHDTAYYGRQA